MKTTDVTLVFQGAFKPDVTREHHNVARNIRRTRKVLPGARLVLSTWAGSGLPPGLAPDTLVESEDPGGLALARRIFRHGSALHGLLFAPKRSHRPIRRLAVGLARRLARG